MENLYLENNARLFFYILPSINFYTFFMKPPPTYHTLNFDYFKVSIFQTK